MFCMHCGKELNEEAEFCMSCGKKPLEGRGYCYSCGETISDGQEVCLNCGVNLINIRRNSASAGQSAEGEAYCRHCGESVYSNAEICVSCGRRPFKGSDYCQNCGTKTEDDQEVCVQCGIRLQGGRAGGNVRGEAHAGDINYYHQMEFEKIKATDEIYKGKWNWAAFFFGWIWALTKGLWLLAVTNLVLNFLFFETIIVPLLIPFFFALRGNYIYYRWIEYGEQWPKHL